MRNQVPFTIQNGDESIVVLLRNTYDGRYTLEYTGNRPARVESLQVMLAGQILYVDVMEVRLIKGEEVVQVVQNQIIEGEGFELNPKDRFDVQVTFKGQSLAPSPSATYNYLYGFRITYNDGSGGRTSDVVDEDYQYVIIVE